MQTETFSYNDEQFADLQMLRYRVDGFDRLSIARKKLIYYLSEAALAGRDILWDQNGKYNLRIRKTLETLYTDYPLRLREVQTGIQRGFLPGSRAERPCGQASARRRTDGRGTLRTARARHLRPGSHAQACQPGKRGRLGPDFRL